jgi:hypothetical protein
MAPPGLYLPAVHAVIVVVEELVVKEPAGTVVQTVAFAPEYVPEGLHGRKQRRQQRAGGRKAQRWSALPRSLAATVRAP